MGSASNADKLTRKAASLASQNPTIGKHALSAISFRSFVLPFDFYPFVAIFYQLFVLPFDFFLEFF